MAGTAASLALRRPEAVSTSGLISDVLSTMDRLGFEHLPVTYQDKVVGYATRTQLRPVVAERGAKVLDTVDRWMTVFPKQSLRWAPHAIQGPSPVVASDAPLDTVAQTVAKHGIAVVVDSQGEGSSCLGIVTQADLDAHRP